MRHNIAKMDTATTGTGTITLGSAVTGFNTFANAGVYNGEVLEYVIRDGASTEVGVGTYTSSGTTLSRDQVLSSTDGGSKISLSGTATVAITISGRNSLGAWEWYEGSSTTNITNGANSTLNFGQDDYVDDAIFTRGASILTLNTGWDGLYHVSAQVAMTTGSSTNGDLTIDVLYNGNIYISQIFTSIHASSATPRTFTVDIPVIAIDATDTLEVRVTNNTGITITVKVSNIFIQYLGSYW